MNTTFHNNNPIYLQKSCIHRYSIVVCNVPKNLGINRSLTAVL